MTNKAFVGNVFLWRGDGGSPEAFSQVCQNFAISGLGQKNDQIEATTFCSGGSKEYIAGLADGAEVTFDLNLEAVGAGKTLETAMITDVKNKATRSFEVRCDGDGDGAIDMTFHFQATCLHWQVTPSVSGKNTISFGCKITGDITVT